MAKALVGHVGGLDPRLVFEMRRLQQRVRDLESEVTALRAENDSLAESISDAHLIALEAAKEPALA
jgi:regulator of replication initiation timing